MNFFLHFILQVGLRKYSVRRRSRSISVGTEVKRRYRRSKCHGWIVKRERRSLVRSFRSRSEDKPSPCPLSSVGSLCRDKHGRFVKLSIHRNLVFRLGMCGVLPPLLVCVHVVQTDNFKLTFLFDVSNVTKLQFLSKENSCPEYVTCITSNVHHKA
jgi:hypothetical protein